MNGKRDKTSEEYEGDLLEAADIPFARHIGLEQEKGSVSLGFSGTVMNHLNTIHASAQFALAETQSGLYLQTLFPELEGKVVPLLREAQIRYRKPAAAKIVASASVDDSAVETFRDQFGRKGRGSIRVDVAVTDVNGVLTSQGAFTWFIQTL
ncbi:YiiD C-terminal domain-containing protein [Sulfurimonas sp. HSL1-6]|uniref:YiiD C-terminal domain-containing protein n=1 Tax=Thiomicrolovo immobilis TaxID=3131935 RepID=UPI0031F7B9E8